MRDTVRVVLLRRTCWTLLALAAVGAVGGCGTHAGPSRPAVAANAQVMFTSCSASASSSSTRPRDEACDYELSDGRRFRCHAFNGSSTPTVAELERSSGCRTLPTVKLPPASAKIESEIGRARSCLASHGLRSSGGALPGGGGPTSADGEVITTHALIAFYTSAAKATRLAPEVASKARRTHARIQRHGRVTIVWLAAPPARLQATVRTCIAG